MAKNGDPRTATDTFTDAYDLFVISIIATLVTSQRSLDEISGEAPSVPTGPPRSRKNLWRSLETLLRRRESSPLTRQTQNPTAHGSRVCSHRPSSRRGPRCRRATDAVGFPSVEGRGEIARGPSDSTVQVLRQHSRRGAESLVGSATAQDDSCSAQAAPG